MKVVPKDDGPIECFYVKLNFRKQKLLLNFSCNSKHSSKESHLDSLSKSIDSLSSKCDDFILVGGLTHLWKILLLKYLGKITNYEIL